MEIHVCDEVKNVKRDFICSQKLLVEKMGYFADVTAGTESLYIYLKFFFLSDFVCELQLFFVKT